MKRIVIAVIVLSFLHLIGCTRPDQTRRVLEQQGYTEVQITGYRCFMKSQSDSFSTGFRAKSPSGTYVTGAVCSGWIKGATIRFD